MTSQSEYPRMGQTDLFILHAELVEVISDRLCYFSKGGASSYNKGWF